MLHISKTGGTTIKQLLQGRSYKKTGDGRQLVLHSHTVTMPDVLGRSDENQVAFFLRHPFPRFVSGFNSRLRQGAPSHDRPWRPPEKVVFENFSTANDLAEALSSDDLQRQDQAMSGIQTLTHTRWRATDWVISPEYLEARLEKVLFVGFQETFTEDLATLIKLLGVATPKDIPHHHQAPSSTATELSELAERNLRDWYADDLALYEWMLERRDRWQPAA